MLPSGIHSSFRFGCASPGVCFYCLQGNMAFLQSRHSSTVFTDRNPAVAILEKANDAVSECATAAIISSESVYQRRYNAGWLLLDQEQDTWCDLLKVCQRKVWQSLCRRFVVAQYIFGRPWRYISQKPISSSQYAEWVLSNHIKLLICQILCMVGQYHFLPRAMLQARGDSWRRFDPQLIRPGSYPS
jgi:hypothetical protein